MSTQTVSIADGDRIEVQQVSGDLQVQGWDRSQLEARADMVLVEKGTGAVIISCSGDLALSIPREMQLMVHAIGGNARLQNLAGAVEISAVGGDVTLHDLSGSVVLNGAIGGGTHLENVANLSMNANSPVMDLHLADRIRHKVEQAAQRAETKVRRAEHKAFQQAQFRSHLGDAGRWTYNAGPDSPSESREPVSDEERLTILRMLQEKKITSEQAEQLLAALEGSA